MDESRGNPGLTTIIETARALGDNPVQALRELGYITPQEASAHAVSRAFGLDAYTDLELAREIVRRIEAGEGEAFDVPTTDDDVPVMTREAERELRADHDLAAKRGRNEAEIPHAE